MKLFSLLTLISMCTAVSVSAGEVTARDAGFTLLQNFQCDNKGDVTQRVVDSINRTRSIVSEIGEKEQACRSAADLIKQLPSVESIAEGITANATVNAIRLQEAVINEALADMAVISSLPADDPKRALYPDTATLQATVQLARAELIRLRAQLSVDQAVRSKTNLISGITQLDDIANGYAAALRGSEACFKARPDIKQHLTAGIIGIAGFFLKGPLGTATSLAGRLFQNLFDLNAAGKSRIQDSFSVADQTAVTLGLGCAFEQMGKQHCRILREKQLFTEMNASSGTCDVTSDTRKLLAQQENLMEALKKIEDWTSKTAVVSQDPASAGMRESAKSNYTANFSKMKQGILAAETTARAGQAHNGDALMKGLRGVLSGYALMINPKAASGWDDERTPSNPLVQGTFTADEQKADILGLILKPEENAQAFYGKLRDEFLKNASESAVNGDQSFRNSPSLFSANMMFSKLAELQSDSQGETTKLLVQRLKDPSTPQLIKARINTIEKTLESTLSSDLSDEQTLSFMNEFSNGTDVSDASASPAASLKLLNFELQEMVNKNPGLAMRSGLATLAASVSKVAKEASEHEKEPDITLKETDPEKRAAELASHQTALVSKQKKFMASLNTLVGRNRQLNTQLNTVMNAQLASSWQSLVKSAADSKSEAAAMQAYFLLNKETLNNTLGFSKNPEAKISEYKGAAALSAANIEGFSRFSEPYMDFAAKYLSGKDVKGKDLPSGVLQNLDPDLKSRFCIQSLSMTQLPDGLRKLCAGQKIRSGELSVSFDEFAGKTQPERSCAYYNFSIREQAVQQKRVGH